MMTPIDLGRHTGGSPNDQVGNIEGVGTIASCW